MCQLRLLTASFPVPASPTRWLWFSPRPFHIVPLVQGYPKCRAALLEQSFCDFCLFPVVQATQKHSLGRNLGKAVNQCFQEPLVKFSHLWSCLELESCITAWRGSSKQAVSQGQSQITEITPNHALAAETMRVFI